MPLIFPAGYFATDLEFESANFEQGTAHVILGWQGNGTDTASSIATAVGDSYVTNLIPVTDASVSLGSVTGYNTLTATEVSYDEPGAGTGDLAPPSIALLTKKLVVERGPRAKGRSYWPGILLDNSLNERGAMSTSDQASYQTRFDDFLIDVGARIPVILQNTEGQSSPLDPPPEVGRFEVQLLAATQRRRLR
jgi:hypothetical protein